MINFLVCLLTAGLVVTWFKKWYSQKRKDKSTQTRLDKYWMEFLCATSPLSTSSSRSFECDENYFGDSERLNGE
jgi:hypothetical protein